MYSNRIISEVKLDQEWLQLMSEARKAGLTIEEIRVFLTQEVENIGMINEIPGKMFSSIPKHRA